MTSILTFVLLISGRWRKWIGAGGIIIGLLLFTQSAYAGGCTSVSLAFKVVSYNLCNNTVCVEVGGTGAGLHGNENFHWDYGDGTTKDTVPGYQNTATLNMNSCHQYLLGGTYTIRLIITPAHTTCDVTTQVTFRTTVSSVQVRCAGDNSGSIDYTPPVNDPTFTYLWNPGGYTVQDPQNVPAGTYTVTVSKGGCSRVDTITVSAPPPLNLNTINVVCTGPTSANTVVTGGTQFTPNSQPYNEPFTYPNGTTIGSGNPPKWTLSGGNDSTRWQLDGNQMKGSNLTNEVIWTSSCINTLNCSTPSVSVDVRDTNGTSTSDTLRIYVRRGTNPDSLIWTGTDINNAYTTITQAVPVDYCVRIVIKAKMGSGGGPCDCSYGGVCGSQCLNCLLGIACMDCPCDPIFKTMSFYAFDNVRVNCTPVTNSGYRYKWCDGSTGSSITNFPTTGICTVMVTDANGCTAIDTVQCSCGLKISATRTNILCPGLNNGTATVTIDSGGTAPFTYLWSPSGGTGTTAAGLSPGTYTVTVTDNALCSATATVTITEPTPLVPTVTRTNVSCNGACDGTATVSVTGGTSPYTYSWSTAPPRTTAIITALCPTTYTVTITDNNGCTITSTAIITEPPPLVLTPSAVGALCGSCDGSASVAATGDAPFTYSWSTAPPQTTPGISNLCTGPYTVIVRDRNGCPDTAVAIVTNTGSPTLTTVTTDVSCFGGSDGTITLTVSGTGTSPFTYLWTPGGYTTQNISGLSRGIYTVTVTDNVGCQAITTDTINEPPPIVPVTNVTPASCPGVCDGTATVTATGGTGAFTYSWNSTPVQTTQSATGLCDGTYTVTVTDNNGCTATATAVITEPPPIVLTTSVTPASCPGACDGTATVNATGGNTGAYTYNWSTTPPQTTPAATGLCATNYTVTVTDSKGCTATTSVTIVEPPPIVLQIQGQSPDCSPSGTATVIPSGGNNAPYTYAWNTTPVRITDIITGLSPGTYCVTVTDPKGCTADTCVTLIPPPTFTLATTKVDVRCFGGTDGSIDLTVTGGTAPFTYLWTPGNYTTEDLNGIPQGTYSVVVRDSNGCLNTTSVTVNEPPPIVLGISGTPPTCSVSGTGTVTASGGTPPYTYLWCNGQTTANATGLGVGTCTVTITDANGCVNDTSITFNNPALPSANFTLTTGCFGTTANFTDQSVAGTGDNITGWSWNFGDPSSSSNTSTTKNTSHIYSAPCRFTATLVITTANGCTDTADKPVDVYPQPVVNFGPPQDGCTPVCVQFADSSTVDTCSASVIDQWLWDLGDGSTSTVQNPNHCYTTPGSYSVSLSVTTNHGCTGSLPRNNIINVYPFPTAEFTMTPAETEILFPLINFYDQSGGAPVLWRWDFGVPGILDDIDSVQNPKYSYPDTGTFEVCLYIENQYKCPATVCHPVVIKPIWTFYIPNAFTPDGDGTNDFFNGKGYNITEYQLWIFDRWGDLVYTTGIAANPESSVPWDGRANDGMNGAEEDVYVWVVKLRDIFNRKHRYVGHVTLVR